MDAFRKPAETLPEHPPLEAAIAQLDLSPPPPLKLAESKPVARSNESSGLELAPGSSPSRPIVSVIGSSVPPPRASFGRDIEREERAARRNTILIVASIWTFAFALVGVLLFMMRKA